MKHEISRRSFLLGSAAALAGCATTPRARGRRPSPNEKLDTAHVGVGGKGRGHLNYCLQHENVVALCDVDDQSAAEFYERCPDVPKFRDWRRMLDKQRDIDAVVVATPDHLHAPIALAAMELGKHVYVEKPLAHSIEEVRRLTESARRYRVATQMGNQGHACDGVRQTCEMLWSGAIGPVREVHCWSDRPIWPQGFAAPLPQRPVPAWVDWDLWLGPAPARPFGGYYRRGASNAAQAQAGYLPFAWRGWWDFGTGALGDMGCHILDPPNWALHLGAPAAVECVQQEGNTAESGPLKSVIAYEFPERDVDGKKLPAVKLYWYDGKILPPRLAALPPGETLPSAGEGSLFIGDEGMLSCDSHGRNPTLHPASRMRDYTMPGPILGRLPMEEDRYDDAHRADWIQACKGGTPAGSNFDYAGPFAETVLLGNVALRTGRRIEWDSAALRITNDKEANTCLRREYRRGWEF
ncbi:MAG: Gfo/Idh/MocA family oxidoreductase [Candidatus Hydrogenedentes bacterium]|nr:Gfo/Idh/MocA family oxidoreductase [Candidatus Hydrogenedentota bacterium]